MAIKVANLAQHEVLPVTKFIELLREQRTSGKMHILTITMVEGCVSYSVAVPRGRVVIESDTLDIPVNGT